MPCICKYLCLLSFAIVSTAFGVPGSLTAAHTLHNTDLVQRQVREASERQSQNPERRERLSRGENALLVQSQDSIWRDLEEAIEQLQAMVIRVHELRRGSR